MSNQTMISVYMPTKNRGAMLKRAIDSVLVQDYDNFELVVVDDGSTDDTPALLEQYRQQHQNFRYFRNEQSGGVAAARNLAIAQAKGEFVTGIDDDDLFCAGRLSSLITAYDDKYAFVCSSAIWDWGHKRKVADGKAMVFGLEQQLSYNHATSQILVKRERMLAIGGFDGELVARLDYDAWTRLIIEYGPAKRIKPASYIISRDPGIERITTSARNIKGNQQFLAKHRQRMSTANLVNQAFWDMYARNHPFGVMELIRQLFAGYPLIKLRYFLRIHFLPNWHNE